MRCKKIITLIIATMLILLPMMSTPVQAVVGKVYNLEAKQTGTSVNFTWSSVSGADGYNVYINTSNNGYEFIGSVKNSKATVIGFDSKKTYRAKICAYELSRTGEKIEGAYSSEINVKYTTDTPTISVSKVQNLTSSQSGEYIALNWNEVSNATGYQIEVGIPGFGYMNIGTALSNNVFIKGAKVGQTYEFRVRAYIITSETTVYGDYSNSTTITLKDDKQDEEIKLDKVTNLQVSNITSNTAYVKWNSVKKATGYEVWLSKNNGKYSRITTTTKTYTEISGLDENTTYKVIIVAFNDEGENKVYAPDSNAVSFKTLKNNNNVKVSKVENVTIKNIYSNGADVTWNKAQNATGYEIWLAKGNQKFEYITKTDKTYASISGLQANTTYRIIITAYNDSGSNKIYASDSNVKSFTTEKTVDLNIQGFTAEVKHRNEAYLQWWKNDDAKGYEVWLAKAGKSFTKQSKDATESSYILYDLDYNTKYSVKVRAYMYKNGQKVYGNFSTVKTFTTEKYNREDDSPSVGKVKNVSYYVVKDTVYLSWDKVPYAEGYEIEFTVPGLGGATIIRTQTNSRKISGLTEKNYKYTARIRAYRIINGTYEYGQYSEIQKFSGK